MNAWAEFRHFKYLRAILELKGFRAAAEQLHTAQPNLSVQAKQFEEHASVRLYEKANDGRIEPTPTGDAFRFIAKSLLEARDEMGNLESLGSRSPNARGRLFILGISVCFHARRSGHLMRGGRPSCAQLNQHDLRNALLRDTKVRDE